MMEYKKITEETIKNSEFDFILYLKTMIATTEAELSAVENAMRRGEKSTNPQPKIDRNLGNYQLNGVCCLITKT